MIPRITKLRIFLSFLEDISNQSKDDTSKLNLEKESSMMVDILLDGTYDDETSDKLHAYVTGENIAPPLSMPGYNNVMFVQPMPSSNMNGTLDISGSSNV